MSHEWKSHVHVDWVFPPEPQDYFGINPGEASYTVFNYIHVGEVANTMDKQQG
jgi:hypothetical protein